MNTNSKNNGMDLNRMKELMNYGKTNEPVKSSLVEFHQVGADGKTYGIIKEGTKYYIKAAPKKDDGIAVLAEDYDYIGGFANRKDYEYNSYASASKNFEFKMKSINEAVNAGKKPVINESKTKKETSEWQINETKEMRAEINRFNDILNNCNYILSEEKEKGGFTMKHTLPEAPKTHTGSADSVGGNPFTDTATAELDKDFNTKANNPKSQGAPFNKKEGSKSSEKGDAYTEKAKYIQSDGTSVADQKGKSTGKKPVMKESKRTVKLTEEQVLAWNKEMNYMDKSHGTKIGSSAPFDDKVSCNQSNQCKGGEGALEENAEKDSMIYNDRLKSPKPGIGNPRKWESEDGGNVF